MIVVHVRVRGRPRRLRYQESCGGALWGIHQCYGFLYESQVMEWHIQQFDSGRCFSRAFTRQQWDTSIAPYMRAWAQWIDAHWDTKCHAPWCAHIEPCAKSAQ
jgi:hypothetical protein